VEWKCRASLGISIRRNIERNIRGSRSRTDGEERKGTYAPQVVQTKAESKWPSSLGAFYPHYLPRSKQGSIFAVIVLAFLCQPKRSTSAPSRVRGCVRFGSDRVGGGRYIATAPRAELGTHVHEMCTDRVNRWPNADL